MPRRTFRPENPAPLAATVIFAAFMIRLWFISSGQLDLVQDEAQYWDWSRRLDWSYYSKGPLIAWVIAFFTAIFGDNPFGVRIAALLFSTGTQIILYLCVAKRLNRPGLGLILLLIANSTPFFLAGSLLMTTDGPLIFFWSAAIAALVAAHDSHLRAAAHKKSAPLAPWFFYIIAVACGITAKYAMLFLPPLALLHLIVLKRLKILNPGYGITLLAASLCGVILGLFPIVIWNMNNDWVSLRHVLRLAALTPTVDSGVLQDAGRIMGKAGGGKPFLRPDLWLEFMGGQIGLLLPWWFAFILVGGVKAVSLMRRVRREQRAPMFAGHSTSESSSLFALSLCAMLFWPIWLFFVCWAMIHRVYPNWTAACYVGGLILAAWAVDELRRRGAPSFWRKLLPLWAGLSLIVFAAIQGQGLITDLLPIPAKYNPASRLKGWADLGDHLERLRRGRHNPDKVFYFSDSYDVTAELAFYGPSRLAYCVDFGRRKNQYDFWPGPQNKKGWDAIYVSRTPLEMVPPPLAAMFEAVEVRQNYTSTHNGEPGRSFGIIVLRNFNGDWPESSNSYY